MLTEAQINARLGKLTGSRIAPILTGDAEKIMRLYREMIGEEQEENLDHIWPVRLGSLTEVLNLDWYEAKNNHPLSQRGSVMTVGWLPWAACTLDAWDTVLMCPVECKHVSGREPLDPVIIDRYQPQMQLQMCITDADQCALSVIMGANEPIVEYIRRDEEYIDEMIKRGEQFMECVRDHRPPIVLDPVPPPADASKIYDMSGSNSWSEAAYSWLATREFAERCKEAEKVLKAQVPADAKKCEGHGVRITRDRAGRLSLREDE